MRKDVFFLFAKIKSSIVSKQNSLTNNSFKNLQNVDEFCFGGRARFFENKLIIRYIVKINNNV